MREKKNACLINILRFSLYCGQWDKIKKIMENIERIMVFANWCDFKIQDHILNKKLQLVRKRAGPCKNWISEKMVNMSYMQ